MSFETDRYELRYLGMDRGFGLLSKIGTSLYEQHKEVLWILGPLITHLVACLHDHSGMVRQKALIYFRAMDVAHLNHLLKIWQSYFVICDDVRMKMQMLLQMTLLNALFPALPVLEWDNVLSAL